MRVVAIDGVTLEVEPEQGGAMDYRERARGRHRTGDDTDDAIESTATTPTPML